MRRLGDRKDGKLIRDIDSMHFIVPLLYPNRCDNEAFISEIIDLTNANEFLKEFNKDEEYKCNYFHLLICAYLKVLYLRPKMNRFIANKNFYQRNYVSASFVVKKGLRDDSDEALAIVKAEPTDTLNEIHDKIIEQINKCRSEEIDQSTKEMDIFNHLPRPVSKSIVKVITKLDVKGKVPQSLIETDPYYSSVVFSLLGSIRLHSGYHHLTNWGTNSIFVTVGEKKNRTFEDSNGKKTLKSSIDIGMTIDERLADGLYYSSTIQLIKKFMHNPELLMTRMDEEIK